MKKSPEKQSIAINGIVLWMRGYGGQMVFARQLEPTNGLYDSEEDAALRTPILVGFDGEYGSDLESVLRELTNLRKENKELKERVMEDAIKTNQIQASEIRRLENQLEDALERLGWLETPWWRRGR